VSGKRLNAFPGDKIKDGNRAIRRKRLQNNSGKRIRAGADYWGRKTTVDQQSSSSKEGGGEAYQVVKPDVTP